MSPQRRNYNNRDLDGTHLQVVTAKTSKQYYYFIYPDGSKEPMKDPLTKRQLTRQETKEVAAILAAEFYQSGNIAKQILENKINQQLNWQSVGDLIDEFIEHYLDKKNHAKSTRKEQEYKLTKYKEIWGRVAVSSLSTRDMTNFLNPLKDHAYIKHRALLKTLFTFAAHQGYIENNPTLNILTRTEPKKIREQHTLEGYNKIYEIAPPWLKRAMDIALRSLQRRGDLVTLHQDQVNLEENTLTILQQKTKNYDNPVYIEILMGEELRQSVLNCIGSGIKCPYLIHYKPKKLSQKTADAKQHPFCVTDDYLTKQFSHYRDQSGAYGHLKAGKKPTWHSIRGLGAWLYLQQGFSEEYTQLLSGHASLKMLKHYTAGHEETKPIRVEAGLKYDSK